MGEYDDTLTLEGKIAVDFAHAMIARNGTFVSAIVCGYAQDMMAALKEHGLIVEKTAYTPGEDGGNAAC